MLLPFCSPKSLQTFLPFVTSAENSVRSGLRMMAFGIVLPLIMANCCVADPQAAPAGVSFQNQVLPILKRNCVKCHGVSKQEGGLQLHSAVRVWKGGESGSIVAAADLSSSLLWTRVSRNEMPPEHPLTEEEKRVLRDWISQGASGLPGNDAETAAMVKDEHWAFTRLQEKAPPDVQAPALCRTPIDRFIVAQLETVGLTLSQEADRRTLIRRVSYCLTGLPPSPAEIDEFLADTSADAVKALINRCLESEQYGVRWGRYWLDAAGYADSNGYFNADSDRPLAYQYRDYVIRCVNADKPFDQFVREQIAGDELSGFRPDEHRCAATQPMIDMLTATHFLRNGQDGTGESDGNPDEVRIDRYTALESAQQIIASSLLGLTFQCAKCHDHKFEPLTQQDFYCFQSVLFPAYNPANWVKPNDRFAIASLPEVYARWQTQIAETEEQQARLQRELRDWTNLNRPSELVCFADDFSDPARLNANWANIIPGDDGPAGVASVTLLTQPDQSNPLPAALSDEGRLKIIEGGVAGDKWLSTKAVFDWTPDGEGQWIQVTFSLLDTRVRDDEPSAARIAFGIALHDFNNSSDTSGGNILIDGNPAGGAAVHLDYPGPSSKSAGSIGSAKYEAGASFGVRITHLPNRVFRLQQLVDGLAEGPHLELQGQDLPDGSFGFEFCCGRSFQVDDVCVEASFSSSPDSSDDSEAEAFQVELKRRQEEISHITESLAVLRKQEPGRIAWVTDTSAEPPDVYLLERGEYALPKSKIFPAPIAALDDDENPLQIVAPENGVPSSGRRLAWARWVTRPGSRAASLMARVQVNRIWQYHFGTGLVSTSENLGMSGADPANAALLDFLAGEFVRSGWSLKSLHRLILQSAVFRQSSASNAEGLRIDPYNRLLWRYPLRRLDADAIRDGQLAMSGDLDRSLGGPYVPTTRNGAAEVIVPEDRPGAYRRAVYLQQRRSQGLSLLNVFDAPMMVVNCTRRPVTTMPLQSLTLLNSNFAVHRGTAMARRLQTEAGESPEARIQLAFVLTTGRTCSEDVVADSLQFLQSQQRLYETQSALSPVDAEQRAWSELCLLLLASNASLYLE